MPSESRQGYAQVPTETDALLGRPAGEISLPASRCYGFPLPGAIQKEYVAGVPRRRPSRRLAALFRKRDAFHAHGRTARSSVLVSTIEHREANRGRMAQGARRRRTLDRHRKRSSGRVAACRERHGAAGSRRVHSNRVERRRHSARQARSRQGNAAIEAVLTCDRNRAPGTTPTRDTHTVWRGRQTEVRSGRRCVRRGAGLVRLAGGARGVDCGHPEVVGDAVG